MEENKKELKAPVYPTLEKDNIVEQTEAQIALSNELAQKQEQRAKRDRDMAIIGDIANLVSKGAAMHGGAWKIGKDENATAVANDKLAKLRESNSKQLAEHLKMRMAAADAARKERNAAKLAQYNADREDYKMEQTQKNADRAHDETVRHHKKTEDVARMRENRLDETYNDNKEKFVINGKEYTDARVAYANLPPEAKVRTRKITGYDRDGNPQYHETETVVDPNATLEQKIQAVRDFEYTQAQGNNNTVEDWTPEEDEIIDYEP